MKTAGGGVTTKGSLLDIPVLILSQLSRKPEDTADGRPRISHLRDSGSIEQDADVVMLLWRPSYYKNTADPAAVLDIGKNRNGATGDCALVFDNKHTQFLDAAKDVSYD